MLLRKQLEGDINISNRKSPSNKTSYKTISFETIKYSENINSKFKSTHEYKKVKYTDSIKLEKVRALKTEILTMKHEELDTLNSDYIHELKDLARVIYSIFG
jgi:hypothetical protein